MKNSYTFIIGFIVAATGFSPLALGAQNTVFPKYAESAKTEGCSARHVLPQILPPQRAQNGYQNPVNLGKKTTAQVAL